jgi:hypothetical protein
LSCRYGADADIIQDTYLKELKAYKAPEKVRCHHGMH